MLRDVADCLQAPQPTESSCPTGCAGLLALLKSRHRRPAGPAGGFRVGPRAGTLGQELTLVRDAFQVGYPRRSEACLGVPIMPVGINRCLIKLRQQGGPSRGNVGL